MNCQAQAQVNLAAAQANAASQTANTLPKFTSGDNVCIVGTIVSDDGYDPVCSIKVSGGRATLSIDRSKVNLSSHLSGRKEMQRQVDAAYAAGKSDAERKHRAMSFWEWWAS